ncbi:MAG: N-acetylglucosamine-6-phosphate deacetylase [Phycisphaerales bacterium]|jgi:N-acetylglucosamine-6-phosphate deacetylase|nr:N-acetylglucosamine-6-phosphate deacetylase [Phycisphaerales bacterium]
MEYFDLQVNGYGGVDFNTDGLTAADLHRACEKLQSDGVAGILATIITEKIDLMCARLARLVELRERDSLATKIISGIHIEGPFISEKNGYRGAHPLDSVIPADGETAKRLLGACGGLLRVVTLAPERDAGCAVTKMFADAGVIVSAGHTDASLDDLERACDAGLKMFTHVGNACPMTGMHRHDNIIQRALHLRERLWLTFIADGVHVPPVALANYLKLAGERAIVVTDAIAPAGLGPGRYKLGRWDLLIGDDMVARAPDGSHFLGAAITMKQSHANLRNKLGLSDERCRQLLVDNPCRAVSL